MFGSTCVEGQGASRAVPGMLFDHEVIEHVGDGAGSKLYAVDHPQSKQLRVLKHVVRHSDRDDRFIEQLQNEHEVGQRVGHPALRKCFELKFRRNWLHQVQEAALLMELVDGTPLEQMRQTTVAQLLDYFRKAAEALYSMHASGFVHCDIKPNNILVSESGGVKVIDYGQACPIMTRKARIQGTPDFIAPEQVRCEPVAPCTDVYNFGASMYWALCHTHIPTLFTAKKGENSFIVTSGIPTPASLNPEVPETLSSLVMECVRTCRDKRPGSMDQIAKRLEVIHFGMTQPRPAVVVSRKPGTVKPPASPNSRA